MTPETSVSHGGSVPTTIRGGSPALLAALPGPVLRLDAGGAFTGLNEEGMRLAESLLAPAASPFRAELRILAENAHGCGNTAVHSLCLSVNDQTRWIETTIIPVDDRETIVIGRDATLDLNMRSALVESRQRYKDLVEISSDFAWEAGLDGAFTFVSPRGALGYDADALVGMAARDLLFDPDAVPRIFAFEAEEAVERSEIWLKGASGSAVCVLASAVPLSDRSGHPAGARGVCRDITVDRARENDLARLKVREQVTAYIVGAVRDEARPTNMLRTAVDSIGRAMSATFCAVYEMGPAGRLTLAAYYGALLDKRGLGQSTNRLCTDFEVHEGTLDGLRTLMTATHHRDDMNGAIALCRVADAPWNDDDRSLLNSVAGQLGIAFRQIADQKELERLSRTDPLTELFNRRAFMDELDRAVNRIRRHGVCGAVFYVDMNNFKAVNDTHGHGAGDEVLKRVSNILLDITRNYDFVARLGGDEFALWIEDIDKNSARRRARDIVRACKDLESSSGSSKKPLGVSIGIAISDHRTDEAPDDLLKRADAAMYRAKNSAKSNISLARYARRGG